MMAVLSRRRWWCRSLIVGAALCLAVWSTLISPATSYYFYAKRTIYRPSISNQKSLSLTSSTACDGTSFVKYVVPHIAVDPVDPVVVDTEHSKTSKTSHKPCFVYVEYDEREQMQHYEFYPIIPLIPLRWQQFLTTGYG